ncbi:MAG: flagellar type III secretion system pore protein FliP [Candidatus Latescibacteria bacterium]|nr:flagellar type III secretion system pore protein FliP [Candidatus Latescibacterota bacterium]
MTRVRIRRGLLLGTIFLMGLRGTNGWAQQGLPTLNLGITNSSDSGDIAVSLQIILLLTILSLAPALLIMLTSFTRIVVVLSFLRHAIGTQQMPPNQLLVGLALFLTLFIMMPVGQQAYQEGIHPFLSDEITRDQALERTMAPIRRFMLQHTREEDLSLFVSLSEIPVPENPDAGPTQVLIPSFIISELRAAFQIGFFLFVPFLVIDMVVASVLMSMGMMMLPPIMISLPFKILLFVLVDGWNLLVRSLVLSFY